MKIRTLDHVALPVEELEASCAFYENVLGLPTIPRPDFSFPGAWYRLGEGQELHLIARDGRVSYHKDRHFALLVHDIEEAADELRGAGAEFSGPKQRPDGAWQIFLQDPDGHFIEICSSPPEDRNS